MKESGLRPGAAGEAATGRARAAGEARAVPPQPAPSRVGLSGAGGPAGAGAGGARAAGAAEVGKPVRVAMRAALLGNGAPPWGWQASPAPRGMPSAEEHPADLPPTATKRNSRSWAPYAPRMLWADTPPHKASPRG